MSTRLVAIFGGTFDPVHLGHLRVAWEASEFLDAEIRMLPARVPPHRSPTVATAEQRVAMLHAALHDQDRLRLDTRELEREGPSYSVDTLLGLREELGPEQPLVLLMGADAFAGLDRWNRWRQLLQLAHVGVLTRPGSVPPSSDALREEIGPRHVDTVAQLQESSCGKVIDVPVTALDISASRIRELLATGRTPRYLLPAALLHDPALLACYRA